MTMARIIRHPSAFLPIAMSLTAFAVVVLHVVRFGTAREADEGTSAHLWQMLMALQLPIIAWFGITWLPLAKREATFILVLQLTSILVAAAPVFVLGL